MRCGISFWILVLSAAGCFWLTGCSGWGATGNEDAEEAEIAEVADDSEPLTDRPKVQSATVQPQSNPTPAPARNAATQKRFPFVKTVVQHLRQQTPEGWTNSRSAIELTLVIIADETPGTSPTAPLPNGNSGGTSYRVEFQRIRFSQELPGQVALTYDSDASQLVIPPSIRPYHGLKNNGFQFRMNRDRQLTDVVGLESFLERCLQPVEPEQRGLVRSSLPVTSPIEAVTFFIDESLGLIPAEVSRAGDNWLRSREISQPVPCVATTRYTLRQVTSEIADVDLAGTIVPPTNDGQASRISMDGVELLIGGGQLLGQCRVDRQTGLPLNSRAEQSLEMTVRLADGTEFPQLKTTVTTLQPADSREQGSITLIGGVQTQPTVRAEEPASPRR